MPWKGPVFRLHTFQSRIYVSLVDVCKAKCLFFMDGCLSM